LCRRLKKMYIKGMDNETEKEESSEAYYEAWYPIRPFRNTLIGIGILVVLIIVSLLLGK